MIKNPDIDFGDSQGKREANQRIEDDYDNYIINSEKEVRRQSGKQLGNAINKCRKYCGMENRNTNYIEVEKETGGRKRKCWCYVIPGKQTNKF